MSESSCRVLGCGKPVFTQRSGLCKTHYHEQWRRENGQGPRDTLVDKTCDVNGCNEQAYHRTEIGLLCRRHDDRFKRSGTVELIGHKPKGECSLDDCAKPHYSQGYCQAHYRTFRRYGTPTPTEGQRAAQDGRKQRSGATNHRKLSEAEKEARRQERRQAAEQRTHCVNGHALTADNVYIDPKDKRICRTCQAGWLGRGEKPTSSVRNADKTHCPRGHEYTPENTYYMKGNRRQCRICWRDNQLKYKYGIEAGEYDRRFTEQDGKCAICRIALDNGENLSVDHDHQTDAVRGLLCSDCNILLGHAKDDSDRLERAATYICSHRVGE